MITYPDLEAQDNDCESFPSSAILMNSPSRSSEGDDIIFDPVRIGTSDFRTKWIVILISVCPLRFHAGDGGT